MSNGFGEDSYKARAAKTSAVDWVREHGQQLAVGLGVSLLKFFALIAAVVIGTAMGNGLPMARTASHAFQTGVQQGLSNCPCAKKSQPTGRVAMTPTPLRPEPAAELVKRVPVPVSEDKQSGSVSPTPALIEALSGPEDVFKDKLDVSRKPEGG